MSRARHALLALVALFVTCAISSERDVLAGTWRTTVHDVLVGTWRSTDGRVLIFYANGKFQSGRLSGCWNRHGDAIGFTWPCMNHGKKPGEPFLAYADAHYSCNFTLTDRLTLKDCFDAGEYRREKEPTAR